ncbi:hypothetical protein BDU57DRAFT_211026 [Ampelomyces quisqualis]|uniref:Uncharacterized protein n=1 Tax=Ampelomyces quisqualis TaxID=50730 RepID=A0A6A5QN60_AMPQU|nr:hypothetical protein BDU57DRAFT_211026 [Ampelomyces quisqualis]
MAPGSAFDVFYPVVKRLLTRIQISELESSSAFRKDSTQFQRQLALAFAKCTCALFLCNAKPSYQFCPVATFTASVLKRSWLLHTFRSIAMEQLQQTFHPHRFRADEHQVDLYHVYDNLFRTPCQHGIGIQCEDADNYLMNAWHVTTPSAMLQHLAW